MSDVKERLRKLETATLKDYDDALAKIARLEARVKELEQNLSKAEDWIKRYENAPSF